MLPGLFLMLALCACVDVSRREPTPGAGVRPTALVVWARRAAEVTRVVDADTIDVRVDGRLERVRLIGVDAPESVDPRRPVACLGPEASARTRELLASATTVEIEPDPTQDGRDRFGRLLAYVWLADGRLLSREIVASGYAREYTYDRPYRHRPDLIAAEREARSARRGLWAPGACPSSPVPTRAA